MKLLLDENLPLSFVERIIKPGFSAEHVNEVGLRGKSDLEIAQYALQQKAIIITKDVEFGSLILYPQGSHYGVIVIRVPNFCKKDQLFQILKTFLISVAPEDMVKSVVILQVGKYRIRRNVF